MNHSFTLKGCKVGIVRKTVGRADPTEITTIRIQRQDGARFTAVSMFYWQFRAGKTEKCGLDRREIEVEFRRHSLPSLEAIEQKADEIERAWSEDPMTIALGGMSSIV